jgi:hypothetical protein
MKTTLPAVRSRLLACLCVLFTALAWSASAQKQKSTDLAGYPLLWSAKKNPLTGPFIPGLNAALLLSDEQKEKLITAREETLNSEKVQGLGAKVKLNPNASAAEREEAQQAQEAARSRFKARVEAVLTPEQRRLVDTINHLYDEVLAATQQAYRGQFEQLDKTDKTRQAELRQEIQQQTAKDFRARLEGTLSREQWAALTQAAGIEETAAKQPVKVKKD